MQRINRRAAHERHDGAPLSTKPIRRVLSWQAVATVAMAAIALVVGGGARGALGRAGGRCQHRGRGVYAVVLGDIHGRVRGRRGGGDDSGPRPCKILVIIAQLWLVLAMYEDVVPVAFFDDAS